MAINESTVLELKKIEDLKTPIEKLFVQEGRSRSYIAKLFDVDRHRLAKKLNEWGFIQGNVYHPTPSVTKAVNANKQKIINMLDADATLQEIADETGLTLNTVSRIARKVDAEINHHFTMASDRRKKAAQNRRNSFVEKSTRNYADAADLPGEVWKPILGYEAYDVSNMGRIRSYASSYNRHYILSQNVNPRSGRLYIKLASPTGGTKAFAVARLVAHAFVDGYSDVNNTVNHKDYNATNNSADNLEWVSQAENNRHAMLSTTRKRVAGYSKHDRFKGIIMDGTYEFKTIRAVAKFLNVSETQAHRYINGECANQHTFKFIY